ncbi:MAG: hypothetical protein ACRCY4_08105 [Brevinema sp.]
MKILFCMMLLLGACSQGFRANGENYRYQSQGADVTVSFANPEDATPDRLKDLSKMVDVLVKEMPASLKTDVIEVEGLTSDNFYNIFVIGHSYFLGAVTPYQNKMAVYAFISWVYNKALGGTLPVVSFEELAQSASANRKEINNYTIVYSLDNIFFVSVIEMFERQDRYFYSARAKDDLFRILFYPELLGFWEYGAGRFGKSMMFDFALKPYSTEDFRVMFGEDVADLEKAFVDSVRAQNSKTTLSMDFRNQYDELLEDAMKNTKQSLMRE